MPKKKAPQPAATFTGTTHICFILDKSGSMDGQRDAAISGFNEFISEQQKLVDATRLTLILFDTGMQTPIEDSPLADAKPITKHDYAPSGLTALFDAVGRGIAMTEPRVGKDDRALVVILTDGLENSSSKITSHDQIKDIIRMKERDGNWTFTYMGSGESWEKEAVAMGVQTGNMTAYDPADPAASMAFVSRASSGLRASNARISASFYSGSPSAPRPGNLAPRRTPSYVPRPASPVRQPLPVVRPLAVHRPPYAQRPRTVGGNPFSRKLTATDDALDQLIARAQGPVKS